MVNTTIAFVTDNGFSEKNGKYYYSGANIQHYNTISQHFNNIIFVARNNPYEQSGNEICEKHEVHLVDSITNIKNIIKNYLKLDNILEDVIKRSDIVMCFGINGYFAYKKALKYKKPIIAYIGGCVYDTLINMNSKLKRAFAPIVMLMIKEMVRNATYVHYVDKYLIEKYPTNGKYLICPSVKINVEDGAFEKRKRKIENQPERIVIGLIGYTYNRIKGIDTAIKALKLLGHRYKLQVVGRGDHSWLDNLASTLGVEKQVEFLGVLPRNIIFNWLDTIDIYIQPSITEGMPRATIEAMSRACPIVSSDVGGLSSIINKKFMIKPGNYHELANKIKLLTQNKTIMLETAKENFEISQKYDLDILDKKRNQFYKMIEDSI